VIFGFDLLFCSLVDCVHLSQVSRDYIIYWHQSEGIRPPFSCRIVSLELPYEENRDLRLCFTIFCCFVDYGVHLQVSRDYNKYITHQ
jgi:hypothetical protein